MNLDLLRKKYSISFKKWINYNIYVKTSASGNMRIYKKEGEVSLFSMDIGANQEKIATVYLSAGNTAAVWITPSSGAYFSGYAIIPD